MPNSDILVGGGGSIYTLTPLTELGKEWLQVNVSQEGFQPDFPNIVYVEHRFILNLVEAIRESGLRVE